MIDMKYWLQFFAEGASDNEGAAGATQGEDRRTFLARQNARETILSVAPGHLSEQ